MAPAARLPVVPEYASSGAVQLLVLQISNVRLPVPPGFESL